MLSLKRGNTVGMLGVNSYAHLTALYQLWQSGHTVALGSTREPVDRIHKWFSELGCKQIVEPQNRTEVSITPFHKGGVRTLPLDQAGTILRTSGSTALPKNVWHTLQNHAQNAEDVVKWLQYDPSSHWLLSLPIYHVGGLSIFIRSLLCGGGLSLMPASMELGEALSKMPHVTHLSLVPTQLYRLMREKSTLGLLRNLRVIVLGGAPCPESLIRNAINAGLSIAISYGLTEMASQVATTQPLTQEVDFCNAISVLPNRELKISSEGEIWVKGPMLFQGYLEPGGLNSGRKSEGWFATGDRGEIIQNNRLQILGRIDNQMISGGENIYPEEIEAALLDYDGIEQAIVVPINDAEFGQRPIAFIKTDDNRPIAKSVLDAHLEMRLAGFKKPIRYLLWPSEVPTQSIKTSRAWFKTQVFDVHASSP